MRSVLLCEGADDLWFVAYYLNKTAGWTECDSFSKSYSLGRLNNRQSILYLRQNNDYVAIWCVAGKDCFEEAIKTLLEKIIENYPFDPIDTIIIMRDRDTDEETRILSCYEKCFSGGIALQNKKTAQYCKTIDGIEVSTSVLPLIIPFEESGAVETLLLKSIQDSSNEASVVVKEANEYIQRLLTSPELKAKYLKHARFILKARFSATIAVTNPDHSTALFRDMVLSCPWEESAYIQDHFGVIAKAITTQ